MSVSDYLEKHRIVAQNKRDPHTGAFDLLRTQVLQKMRANNWRTLGISSPTAGSGKSVTAINLAISIAQLPDQSCLLLDFDLRRPSVLEYLGVDQDVSLNEYFNGECSFADTLSRPVIPKLAVAGARKSIVNSAEVLSAHSVTQLIQDVKQRYKDRIVIFDLPPMIGTDDSLMLAPSIDCALLVVGNGMSTREEVERSVRHLAGTELLGTVLNRSGADEAYYYGAYGS